MAARILALAPHDSAAPARAVQWAVKGVAARPGEACCHHTLAVAQYRARQFEAAEQSCRQSLKLAWGGHVLNWLVLAMVHQRLGHDDQARQWLNKAVQWIDQAAPRQPSGTRPILPVPSWTDRLEVLLLRREAEALLGREEKKN